MKVGGYYKRIIQDALFVVEVIQEESGQGYNVKVITSINDTNNYNSVGKTAFLQTSAVPKWIELTELDKALL
jgi:uncharacterized protein (UPF0335 family)